MTLRLHNTLTKTKDDFVPLDPKNVRMYVCGPTVYDYAHIGNARPAIVFDVLFRLLRHLYGHAHVTYVRNITDVDDKINVRALEISEAQKIPIEAAREQLTAATAKQYHDDVDALGCLRPTREPRATEYIRQMVQMIEMLIKKGHAYEEGGHVLYDVGSKKDYGKLSRRSVDDMIAGARVDVAPYKANPMDFVLWKPSTPEQPGWEHNKWGRGRPGWHIECSAMSDALLGETFDIHGGGIDLIFPHHENEIAQSEGAHADAPPARYWLHNGFLQVEGEKMSKSLGNFVTIRELLNDWPGEVLRLNMLRSHYRQPIDWTLRGLSESARVLDRWYEAVANSGESINPIAQVDFLQALLDDLNTPLALGHLSTIGRHVEGKMQAGEFVYHVQGANLASVFVGCANVLGLLQLTPAQWKQAAVGLIDLNEKDIHAAIEARNAARKTKNWKESDRIRDELLAKGIQLKDNPDGTTSWEVKR